MEYEASPLEKEIISRYPEQFQGGEFWLGISIDEGWTAIIIDACHQMQMLLSEDELRRFHWTQIKQKWGRLKMYWRPRNGVEISCVTPDGIAEFGHVAHSEISDEVSFSAATLAKIEAVIDQATERASCTCESCGSTGRLRDDPCVRVLCDVCRHT